MKGASPGDRVRHIDGERGQRCVHGEREGRCESERDKQQCRHFEFKMAAKACRLHFSTSALLNKRPTLAQHTSVVRRKDAIEEPSQVSHHRPGTPLVKIAQKRDHESNRVAHVRSSSSQLQREREASTPPPQNQRDTEQTPAPEKKISPAERQRVRILFVSFDLIFLLHLFLVCFISLTS